jgi:GH25 family lysozyme M1 (1,4-beta-N-acetylmuramidase)
VIGTSVRFVRTASAAVAVLAFASAWLALPVAVAQEGPGPSGAGGIAGAPVVVEQPVGSLPGIDVSHWQETIDWAQVAASGQRFAVAKATEGQNYVDPMYATNAAGAAANGIVFGAYHFAKPDDTPNDAVLEADHFVDVAQLVPGNLVPALDIERTGGLTQAELTQWILTWLGRVTDRLGVKPMVYTSPHGWLVRTGDTTAVADAGYTILWVAHWGVSSPTLPANDWQGNGWTFWQYTDCGTVPGIAGCVDLDWFAGTSFEGVTIPSPDVTPPAVTITPPSDLAGPFTVAFSEVVHQVTAGNTVLYRPDASAYEDVTITCRSGKGVDVDCLDGSVRVALVEPNAPLIPGETYLVVVNLPGALPVVVDRSGNPAPTTQLQFATPTELEQDSPAVSYGWRTVSAADARGGSYVTERRAGATASFAFVGRSVTWITMTGPTQGKAVVSIDGSRIGVFDQYSAGKTFGVERPSTGLARGEHVVAIRVLGKASAASSDTLVAVDGFEVGTNRVPTPDLDLAWGRATDARASGGSYAASDLKGSSLELTFRGTGVLWTTLRGPRQGRAAIYVDGALVRTVDDYASEPTFGVIRTVSGLPEGLHTLRIVVLGEGRPAAEGTLVSADAFSVLP